MSSAVTYPHIAVDEHGTARVGHSRYKVLHLATEHHHYGWSGEELLRQHPDLRPEEVYAALTYFYDHYADMILQMQQQGEAIDVLRSSQSLSRAELLARKQGPR